MNRGVPIGVIEERIQKLPSLIERGELLPEEFRGSFLKLRELLAPYTKRAYLVGGVVRDYLMGRRPGEVDIEVYDLSPSQFEELMEGRLGARGVGKSFFVYKWHNFDISLPRRETKVGAGHRGFEVEVEQDEVVASRRRDFRINSMMIGIFNGEFRDYHRGVEDLSRGVLRHISDETFVEDPLRVLRGVQFSARFGFKIAEETCALSRQLNLLELSKERIYGEFEKMFRAPFLYYGFFYLIKTGAAAQLFNFQFSWGEIYRGLHLFRKNPHPLYFLYHLRHLKGVSPSRIIDPLAPPKNVQRLLSLPRLPKQVTNRFLIGLGWRTPLRDFLELNNRCCWGWAEGRGLITRKWRPDLSRLDRRNPRGSIRAQIRELPLETICRRSQCITGY